MNRLGRKIELVANVCIIAFAIVIGVILVKRFLLKSPSNTSQVSAIAAGTKIDLPGMDWSKNDKTLLLILSTRCKYCSASAPFYQKLANETAPRSVRLVAVLPESVDLGRNYLKDLNVHIDDVKQTEPSLLGVRATPTLIPRQQRRSRH
ncbi:MAG: hypothetical protein ACXW18_02705 [Pyrinomonadaceae bacterium]